MNDDLEPTISFSDKDLSYYFTKIVQLSTCLIFRFEKKLFPNEKHISEDIINEDFIDDLKEEFLDEVFGISNKIKRDEYIQSVSKTAYWILSSRTLRSKIN